MKRVATFRTARSRFNAIKFASAPGLLSVQPPPRASRHSWLREIASARLRARLHMSPASVRLVRTAGLSVLRQLKLEEALLRADGGNWCLVNDGAASTTAVLGLSGCVSRASRRRAGLDCVTHSKPGVMLHASRVLAAGVPVVRRFSGGGTVVVDCDTQLVSFIFAAQAAPDVQLFPAPLMKWSGQFYAGVFAEHADFRLRENGTCRAAAATAALTRPRTDYVFGDRKFGGNAQSIIKGRWVHHTSFLWDFQSANMELLRHPPRMPAYRQVRANAGLAARLGPADAARLPGTRARGVCVPAARALGAARNARPPRSPAACAAGLHGGGYAARGC